MLIPDFITVTLGLAVFLGGGMLNKRFSMLRRLNIPEAVSGGLLASLFLMGMYLISNVEIVFALEARDFFLVLFFAGIGLNARLGDLISGGRPLAILLVLTLLAILVQNLIGGAGAAIFGYPAQVGVLFGSAALIGGHGTAIAWAPEVAAATGLSAAPELGVAVATLGLVLAAVIGGPIAGYLIQRDTLTPDRPDQGPIAGLATPNGTPTQIITADGVMRSLLYLNFAIILGYGAWEGLEELGVKLPLFVPCLVAGIVIANLRALLFPAAPSIARTPSLALISEVSLGVFLAVSLMSLQLWTIADLGPAILAVMVGQTLFTVLFVLLVLFPLLGGGYRAAVLAAGFGGFALGATPTAIANMTAVTKRYGPSPIAFVVLPLVSAFFVDIANAIVIQTIVNF
jgi:ESS family glutamate:Na+ symporter